MMAKDRTEIVRNFTKQQSQIYQAMVTKGTTYDSIQEETKLPRPTIRRICHELKSMGLISEGSKAGFWRIIIPEDEA